MVTSKAVNDLACAKLRNNPQAHAQAGHRVVHGPSTYLRLHTGILDVSLSLIPRGKVFVL